MSHQCNCNWVDSPHETFGQCVRSKDLKIGYCASWKNHDYTAQKHVDRELEAYRNARRQGVQPKTTKLRDTRKAMEISDRTGKAYVGATR